METVTASPLTADCSRLLARRQHALFGISALNGYFAQGRITSLLRWGIGHFAGVDVLLPGEELRCTLRARGCSEGVAGAKARAAVNNARNRVCRALRELGVRPGEVRVFTWSELAGNPAYARLRAEIEETYAGHAGFRAECLRAVEPVVGEGGEVEAAIPFLLAELPLVVDSPAILGTPSSLFCYPRPMPLVHALYGRRLPVVPAKGQGFVVAQPSSIT